MHKAKQPNLIIGSQKIGCRFCYTVGACPHVILKVLRLVGQQLCRSHHDNQQLRPPDLSRLSGRADCKVYRLQGIQNPEAVLCTPRDKAIILTNGEKAKIVDKIKPYSTIDNSIRLKEAIKMKNSYMQFSVFTTQYKNIGSQSLSCRFCYYYGESAFLSYLHQGNAA